MRGDDLLGRKLCVSGDKVEVRCEGCVIANGDLDEVGRRLLSAHTLGEERAKDVSHLLVRHIERIEVDQDGRVCGMDIANVRMREFGETTEQRHHLSVVFWRDAVAKTNEDGRVTRGRNSHASQSVKHEIETDKYF